MMCAPRSAVPEVATAKSRPATTAASVPGRSGSAIPMRHGRPGSGSPAHCTSPAPLTLTLVCPTAVSMAAACSIDQPLTNPDGSNRPRGPVGEIAAGKLAQHRALRDHLGQFRRAVGQPGLTAAEPAHVAVLAVGRERRVDPVQPAQHGGQHRRGRGGHVEREDRAHDRLGVPQPLSRRHGHLRLSSAGACTGLGLVQRALQRLYVPGAGVAGPGHRVDLRTLRGQRLGGELGQRVAVDLPGCWHRRRCAAAR